MSVSNSSGAFRTRQNNHAVLEKGRFIVSSTADEGKASTVIVIVYGTGRIEEMILSAGTKLGS